MNKNLCQHCPQHYANHYCNSGPTLGQRNFEDILTLGQRCANMLGQRWDTLHLQRWPNIESQRWPNKVNNVGPTLGQRMRAVWICNRSDGGVLQTTLKDNQYKSSYLKTQQNISITQRFRTQVRDGQLGRQQSSNRGWNIRFKGPSSLFR